MMIRMENYFPIKKSRHVQALNKRYVVFASLALPTHTCMYLRAHTVPGSWSMGIYISAAAVWMWMQLTKCRLLVIQWLMLKQLRR